MSDKLTKDELRAYRDFLAHGGTPVVIPPAPMVEEPEWMHDLEEIYGVPILDDTGDGRPTVSKELDHGRPYEPRHTTEQEWRDTWR